MKTLSELEKIAEKMMNDGNQEKWENGELGQSYLHARVIPSNKWFKLREFVLRFNFRYYK